MRTFQGYSKKIHHEDKEVWYSITSNELESEFLKLKESYEIHYRECKTLLSQEK